MITARRLGQVVWQRWEVEKGGHLLLFPIVLVYFVIYFLPLPSIFDFICLSSFFLRFLKASCIQS